METVFLLFFFLSYGGKESLLMRGYFWFLFSTVKKKEDTDKSTGCWILAVFRLAVSRKSFQLLC